MLVYLNGLTWTSGGSSIAFAAEVKEAITTGVHVLPAHEMEGIGQSKRAACPFEWMFACARGDTPKVRRHKAYRSS